MDLKQITLRGIPEEIAEIVKREARRKGASLNKIFISLLENATGLKKAKKRKILYHDLDHLFGKWTDEEAKTFTKNLSLQREIDEDLWKKIE